MTRIELQLKALSNVEVVSTVEHNAICNVAARARQRIIELSKSIDLLTTQNANLQRTNHALLEELAELKKRMAQMERDLVGEGEA